MPCFADTSHAILEWQKMILSLRETLSYLNMPLNGMQNRALSLRETLSIYFFDL